MTDATDDMEYWELVDMGYCKKHEGLWPHECGCDEKPPSHRVKHAWEEFKEDLKNPTTEQDYMFFEEGYRAAIRDFLEADPDESRLDENFPDEEIS